MAFQVPASKASKGQDSFEFTIGTDKFKVRKMKYIKIDLLTKIEGDGAATVEFFCGGHASGKQYDAIHNLEADQFTALGKAWRDDSEVTPGESQGSAT